MDSLTDSQRPYWDRAASKTFTHPLHEPWLREHIAAAARILDYGCGYGRALNDLSAMGFRNTVGFDFAPAMIARGRRESPALDLRVVERLPLDEPEASFDAVLLLAVLTCIPADREQDALLAELKRLLKPGGILYVSDMPLQADARNRARYTAGEARFGSHGVFETDDGAVVRHFDERRFTAMLGGFEEIDRREVALNTMNGNAVTALQMLLRRPA